jgi:hypothetical protein
MSQDKNIFGGGNPNSLYIPLSEIEQEVISRLVESDDLEVHLVDWGVVHQPRITFGDLRIQIRMGITFSKPEVPMYVPYFDMELRTHAGQVLYKERQSTVYGGNPIQIAAGVFLDMVWDIALQNLDPKLVRSVIPGATGYTSRLQDKDTKDITLVGNMNLNSQEKKLLRHIREGELLARAARANKK